MWLFREMSTFQWCIWILFSIIFNKVMVIFSQEIFDDDDNYINLYYSYFYLYCQLVLFFLLYILQYKQK